MWDQIWVLQPSNNGGFAALLLSPSFLPCSVWDQYEDAFPDELPGLPPPRDVDFRIELHHGTLPISMTPHRMSSVELQELKVQM